MNIAPTLHYKCPVEVLPVKAKGNTNKHERHHSFVLNLLVLRAELHATGHRAEYLSAFIAGCHASGTAALVGVTLGCPSAPAPWSAEAHFLRSCRDP